MILCPFQLNVLFLNWTKPESMRIALMNILLLLSLNACSAQGRRQTAEQVAAVAIQPGAYSLYEYLPLLKNKRVALLVNQTSEVNGVLLPDTLLQLKVNVVKIFSPEHGFRGNADAGAHVSNGEDAKTGLPIISLYGKNKKPAAEQLKDIDVVVYDLQDVGARFYTYIATLQYMMEACAGYNKQLIILDRPDPLGFIVDGPVLKKNFQSFVGMQPVPVIYGMTPGEYAQMLIGEGWISAPHLDLKIIACKNYTHHSLYQLPVAPSPNLKTMAAVYLYPSLCLFEGTVVSVGRGTEMPFQQYGNPELKSYTYAFTPTSMPGAGDPPMKDKACHGELLAKNKDEALEIIDGKFQLQWLLKAYRNYPDKPGFFTSFFDLLAGTDALKKQIRQGLSEAAIRESWQEDLTQFKKIRKKYLLYEE